MGAFTPSMCVFVCYETVIIIMGKCHKVITIKNGLVVFKTEVHNIVSYHHDDHDNNK